MHADRVGGDRYDASGDALKQKIRQQAFDELHIYATTFRVRAEQHDSYTVGSGKPTGIGKSDIGGDQRPTFTRHRRLQPVVGPTVHPLGEHSRGIITSGLQQDRNLHREVFIDLELWPHWGRHDAFRIDCIVNPRTASAA